MKFLLDTNILVRLAHRTDSQHKLAWDAAIKLFLANAELFIVPQNVYEFWSVSTRPTQLNGLGLTASQATIEITRLRTFFDLLLETPDFFAEWGNWCPHSIIGKNAHDTRLVAAMIVHGITHC